LLGRFNFKTLSTEEQDELIEQLIIGTGDDKDPGADILAFMKVQSKFNTLMEHEWYHDMFLDDTFKVYLGDAKIVSNDKNIGNFKDLRFPLYTQIHTVMTALPTVFDKDDLANIVPLLESTEKIEPLTKLNRLIGKVGLKTESFYRAGTGKDRKDIYRIVQTGIIERYSKFVKIAEIYKQQLSLMKSKELEPILPKVYNEPIIEPIIPKVSKESIVIPKITVSVTYSPGCEKIDSIILPGESALSPVPIPLSHKRKQNYKWDTATKRIRFDVAAIMAIS
jgi:hypothetical protein